MDLVEEASLIWQFWLRTPSSFSPSALEEKGLLLACHVDSAQRGPTRGDPDRLRQVLINLINNAIKFTEKGEIVVAVTRTGDAPFDSLRSLRSTVRKNR